MTNLAVVDASVVFKWQLEDEDLLGQALKLRDDFYERGTINLIAPRLLAYELVNGVVMAARRKRIDECLAADALANLLGFGVELREVEPARVLDTALKHNLAAYDAAYLALAMDEQCDLWTGDRAMYRMVRSAFPQVKWIGDYASAR